MLAAFVVIMIVAAVWGGLVTNTVFNNTMTTANQTGLYTKIDSAINVFDYAIVAGYIMINLAAIILAYFVKSHPILYVVLFISVGFLMMFSVIASNIYYEFASSPMISPYASTFVLTNLLFENLPLLSLVSALLIGLAMYAGGRGGGAGYAY